MNKEKGVIYLLTNRINGKQYIGQTICINRRIREHKVYDRQVVDKAIDKYGWDNFTIEILADNISVSELDEKEIKYIGKYDTFEGCGYNFTAGGKNHEMTEEIKEKIRENHPEFKGKNNPMYNKHHSEETRQKIREAQLGKKSHNYGKELSMETRRKLSRAKRGARNSQSKITKKEAREIKEKYEETKDTLQEDLAEEYGVSGSLVSQIIREEHWATKKQKEVV